MVHLFLLVHYGIIKVMKKQILTPIITSLSFFVTFVLIAHIQGIAPFKAGGVFSLATEDAYYQYMDFFGWFKDVLSGKQSVSYTFSSYLGTNAVALYAYYLASPLSLLIGLFGKSQMQECYNIMVCLKLTLSAGTFSWYLQKRFDDRIKIPYVILLSLSYSMMQYSITQSCNIMWLDALYIFPLMLLGVYRLVREKNTIYFSIVTAICILCNWYMGGICCLISFVWFLAEYFLQEKPRAFICCFARFLYSGITGVLLSMFLFLPAIYVLLQGTGNSFNLDGLRNVHFFGDIWHLVWGYSAGITTTDGYYPGIYAGALPLTACVLYFTGFAVKIRQKIVNALLVIFLSLSMLWYPLYLVFSLMKNAQGYYCRYSFVWSTALLYIAGQYLALPLKQEKKKTVRGVLFFTGSVFLILAAAYADRVKPHDDRRLFVLSLCLFALVSLLVFAVQTLLSKHLRQAVYAALVICCIADLSLNENALVQGRKWDIVSSYKDYSLQQTALVKAIKDTDDGLYRIEQTQTRSMNYQATTANYNEGLGYNYMPASGYTSCPPNEQIAMMEDLGYANTNEGRMLIKNTFLQPVDSLLGIKYLMSPYAVNGMTKVEKIAQENGKDVYRNDNALPLAFITDSSFQKDEGNLNYFERWNMIYRNLSGTDTDIMVPLTYTAQNTDSSIEYTVNTSSGNYAVYGYIPSGDAYADGTLTFGSTMSIPYSKWQSVNVFYCPSKTDSDSVSVLFQATNIAAAGEAQFYGLDLAAFKKVTSIIKDRAAGSIDLQNGKARITVKGDNGHYLFTSIPYDAGWKISRNGSEVKPVLFDNCLMMIPLESGTNDISMTYHVPWRREGILLTFAGLALLFAPVIFRKLHHSAPHAG